MGSTCGGNAAGMGVKSIWEIRSCPRQRDSGLAPDSAWDRIDRIKDCFEKFEGIYVNSWIRFNNAISKTPIETPRHWRRSAAHLFDRNTHESHMRRHFEHPCRDTAALAEVSGPFLVSHSTRGAAGVEQQL